MDSRKEKPSNQPPDEEIEAAAKAFFAKRCPGNPPSKAFPEEPPEKVYQEVREWLLSPILPWVVKSGSLLPPLWQLWLIADQIKDPEQRYREKECIADKMQREARQQAEIDRQESGPAERPFEEALERVIEKDKALKADNPEFFEAPVTPETGEISPWLPERQSPESSNVVPFPEKKPGLEQEIPRPEKPRAVRKGPGRKRKLAFIPGYIYGQLEEDGHTLLELEIYRIDYTFCKTAKNPRQNLESGIFRHPPAYVEIYLSQLISYLKIRKRQMLKTLRGEKRKQALRMGTSRISVQRAIAKLHKTGWVMRVVPPKRHERPTKYCVAMNRMQRDIQKGCARKMKEQGGPQYWVCHKDLWKS